jgi:hypothetical protein
MFSFLTIICIFAVAPFASAAPIADDHCGSIPHDYKPTPIATLPDPFTFINGDRVESKSDYRCRQREISKLIQQFELGTKPSDPDSVTASFANNTLAITVTNAGKSISFNAPITYPATGKAPYPAIIAVGGIYVKPAQPEGVAIINFNNDEMGAQASVSSRGQGLFYDLYGKDASAGAMVAWAWGVSRIIDALEITPSAKINTDYLGTTSCSRNGKGAFVVGALDDRIALTIPQESGTGGSGCWRIADANKVAGKNIQTADEFVQENVWAGPNFNAFTNNTAALPHDHHMLAGLVAPRGLLVIDNNIDVRTLSPDPLISIVPHPVDPVSAFGT